jgi:glutamine synthetase
MLGMFRNVEQVFEFCRTNGIAMIDLKAADMGGKWRHLTLPVERLLPRTFERGVGFDGSNYGFARAERSDLLLTPDLTTGFVDPFFELPTLSFICNAFMPDAQRTPCPGDPRHICHAAQEFALSAADEVLLGPEFEFYVFDAAYFCAGPSRSLLEIRCARAEWACGDLAGGGRGYAVPQMGGYHASPPADGEHDLRGEAAKLLQEAGVAVKYHHHEVGGPGQAEIEIEPAPPVIAGDRSMLVKYMVKNVAASRGRTATFMPKPIAGEAGSGMHVHMELLRAGTCLFADPAGYAGLSRVALNAIGGLLQHAPALLALTSPSTNSYRRLVPGFEAPASICFGHSNRTSVVRVPGYLSGEGHARFEFRPPDAACNPYLALAALVMAALDGIRREMDPVRMGFGPYDVNVFELPPERRAAIRPLPRSLPEALDGLRRDRAFLELGGVFPPEVLDTWIALKEAEARGAEAIPTPQEFVMYYDV